MRFYKPLFFFLCAGIQTAGATEAVFYANVGDGLQANFNYFDINDIEDVPKFISIPAEAPDPTTGVMTPVVEIGSFNQLTTIQTVEFGSSILRISNGAFDGCTNLTSVGLGAGFNMPESVQEIGSSAFADCTSLFVHNDDVVVNVPIIHALAFANTGLHKFTFGPNVRQTTVTAVRYNPGLESVTFAAAPSPEDKLLIEDGGKYWDREDTPIPVVYANRPLYSFYDPSKYVDVDIKGLTAVHLSNWPIYQRNFMDEASGKYAMDIYVGPGVEEIRYTGFTNLYPENPTDFVKLTNSTWYPDGENVDLDLSVFPALADIDHSFSYSGISYSTITLPGALTSLYSSFEYASIDTMVIPEGPEMECHFCDMTMNKLYIDRSSKIITSPNYFKANVVEYGPNVQTIYGFPSDNLEKVIISDNVTAIERHAFSNSKALKEIVGGKNVETIGDNAFYGCSALEHFVLSENLISIDDYAFEETAIKSLVFHNQIKEIPEIFGWVGNPNLRAISFGNSVEKIDCRVFKNASDLSYLRLTAATPPESLSLDYYEEFNYSDRPFTTSAFVCPTESYSDYASADFWKHFITNRHRVNINIEGMDGLCSVVVSDSKDTRADEGSSDILMPIANGETIAAADGSSVTLRFDIPEDGSLKSLTVDGTDVTSQVVGNEYTIADIRSDKTVAMEINGGTAVSMPSAEPAYTILTDASGSLRITGAEGKSVAIFSVDGMKIFSTDAYANETLTGLTPGLYICLIDGTSTKVYIK